MRKRVDIKNSTTRLVILDAVTGRELRGKYATDILLDIVELINTRMDTNVVIADVLYG